MLEYDWLYDRAWEIGLKEGIKRGRVLAYREAAEIIINDEIGIGQFSFDSLRKLSEIHQNFIQLADKFNGLKVSDPIPHEEIANSRLFHHVRANQLEKLLNRFLQDKDSDPTFPWFNCTEGEKEKQSILAFLEEKGLPKVTQIYLYASLDAIDFYLRKAHEYMQRVLSVSTTDKNLDFPDIDLEIFIEEITLEIQMARLTSLRIKNDYPNF